MAIDVLTKEELRAQLAAVIAERDRLAAALKFYASPKSHTDSPPDIGQGFSLVDLDEGQRARDALKASGHE